MAVDITTVLPILVGLVFVAFAVLERGYKTFLEAKKVDTTLKFSGAYLLNLLVSTGVTSVIIMAVVPAVLTGIGSATQEITFAAIILQAVLGYTTAYTILDKMNKSTETKVEVKA